MPVLDTTALVDADLDDNPVAGLIEERFEAGEQVVVPIQAAIEYCTGRADPAAGFRRLREAFHVVECTQEIGLEAARLARASHAAGLFPGWADIQIGATASYLGLPVVTRNAKHFEPLGLDVLGYDI